MSGDAVLRIVFRPVTDSEPQSVPNAEPTPPASGEPTAPDLPQAEAPKPAADERGGASPGAEAPSPQEPAASAAAADGPASPSDGAEPVAASDEGGDLKKRRRRRRRRKKTGEASADAVGGAASPATGDAGAARSPRAARARKKSPRQPQERRRPARDSQHTAMQAVRALADMAQSLLKIEGVDPLAMPRYLDLNLRVPLDGGNDVRHAAGTAVEQILQRVREVREHEQALRPGAVYSYFSDSSHAEGCRPTEPRHVFDGYSSTGKPNFTDFVTMAIERKAPEVERMLAGEEIVITHVTMGRVLRTQQLAEFGGQSPVFKILGQVNAGLFRTLNDAGRCAFSFQLLRGKTLEGRVRLRLHCVGAIDPMDLADPALMQILSRCQRKLDTEALRLEGKLKNGEVDEEEFVLPLLQDLAKQLQGRARSAGRRTQHGLERSEQGQRPTSRAYPDASEASDNAIMWDIDQSTVVVVGQKGRVHVFTPDGRHVTSVVMQRAAIDRRRQQGRWRQAEPEERGEFRINIKRLVAAGEDTTSEDDGLPGAGL
ncbi:MAG: hypothetical protein CMJ88_12145 [Planctomycetes bacterium]|nr:hypothetical protein [Planctomycetota bacterium]